MIRIAHEIRKEKPASWLLRGLVLGASVLVIGFLIAFWQLRIQIRMLEEEKASLENLTRQAPTLQRELKELQAKRETYQKRLSLLQSLEKDRHGPTRLMEYLAVNLPVDQLWLTTLKENGPEIRLEGLALTNEILADFIKRLEAFPVFRQVDLNQSLQTNFKEIKVKQFSLSAWTQAPPPPEEKK